MVVPATLADVPSKTLVRPVGVTARPHRVPTATVALGPLGFCIAPDLRRCASLPMANPTATRHRSSSAPPDRDRVPWAVTALAALAAVGAVLADAAPTGLAGLDAVLSAVVAVALVLAFATARRWAWLTTAGMAALGAQSTAAVVLGAAAVGLAFVAGATVRFGRDRRRLAGAAVGALTVQVLFRSDLVGWHGGDTAWAVLACVPVLASAYRAASRTTRRRVVLALAGVAAFVVVAVGLFAVAAAGAWSELESGRTAADRGLAALRRGEQAAAAEALQDASAHFDDAGARLRGPLAQPARLVPVVGQHALVAEQVASSGVAISDAAVAAATTAPYSELRTVGGQVDLGLVAAMADPLDEVAAALAGAEADLAAVDSPWLLPPVDGPLDDVIDEVAATTPGAELSAEAARMAPALLGGDGPRRYAIAFANPAESRLLGGFVGGYGMLTAVDGQLELESSGRVDDLERPDEPVDLGWSDELANRYARWEPGRFLQNATVTPDFPTDAAAMARLLPAYGLPEVDGVIYVDPIGLAALLELTGPVTVDQLDDPVTADDVADLLLRDQYLRADSQDERSDLLTDVADATFDALTTRDLPSPDQLVDELGAAVAGGHLLLETFEADQQGFLSRLGARGGFPPAWGTDLVSVRMSNEGPNKLDAYIERDLTYDVVLDRRQRTTAATLEVTLRNTAPADLPDYVAGSAAARDGLPGAPPAGDDELYVSVYTPGRLVGASLDAAPVPVESQPEGRLRAHSVVVVVPRGGEVVLRLDLEGQLDPTGAYSLTLVPQALARPDSFAVQLVPATDTTSLVPGEGLEASDDGLGARGQLDEVERFEVRAVPRR